MANPSDLDQWLEMLTVGPFGGLDPTTPPYYLAPTNFVDGENFVPNHGYGGFVTVMGRTVFLAEPLPGPCNGMHIMHRQGAPDLYLFAVDYPLPTTDAADNPVIVPVGRIYHAEAGGVPARLMLPMNMELTAGQQTYFADCQSWVFLTNGVDRPLKIGMVGEEMRPQATYWGILAPTEAPIVSVAGPGVLLGQYNYCFTWGNSVQESSQGVISAAITATQASATSDALQLSGKPKGGETISIFVGSEGLTEYGVDYIVPSPPPKGGLTALAQAVASNFNANAFVTQYATAGAPTAATAPNGQILLTASQAGTQGNDVYAYGRILGPGGETSGLSLSITPQTRSLLSGGANGNTILVRVPPDLTANDGQVDELNLYRIGGSLGTWNLIATLHPAAGDTTFYDTIPDTAVTGQQLVIFRDAPPPFKYICMHMERIWGFNIPNAYNPTPQYNIAADPSVMWWSNLNEPWGFNSATNNFTCGDNKFSDIGVGLMELGGVLMAVKSRRCYFIYGTTDDDFQALFAWFVGSESPLSLATGYGVGFWLSRQGVHMTDGNSKQQISDAGFQQSNIKNILDTLNDVDYVAAVGWVYDRQYYLSFPTRDFTVLYDMRDQQWYKLAFSLSQVAYDLESDIQVLGMDNKVRGQVDQWFNSPCDFDEVISARLLSRTSDGGQKQGTKRLERGLLLAPIQPGACAKVIITGDPGCETQTTAVETIDLGRGVPRREWGVGENAGGAVECDTFNVLICVDGPATIYAVSVFGWVVRVHAMGGAQQVAFESAGVG